MDRSARRSHRLLLVVGFGIASALSIATARAQQGCGGLVYPFPYTDVESVGAPFCPGIMEAYVTGVSKGTSPTTFSPNETVSRVQMTTFMQRSLDQGLARTSRRGALNQWWTRQYPTAVQGLSFGAYSCAADGADIWVGTYLDTVVQVQANTGKVLGTWTGLNGVVAVVVAADMVFAVTTEGGPGMLYAIDPTQAPGPATLVANTLGNTPEGIAFDGTNLWTVNLEGGSVSIITPQSPYTVTTVSTGFDAPIGILYDGARIWVTDLNAGTLLQLDSMGNIVQTVPVGLRPRSPVFDGANIWVPSDSSNSITVVQASTGNVVATITADASNQLNQPIAASFDGERILVTNQGNNTVTVFKAADLSFIANVSTGALKPTSACSDGINFWIPSENGVLRF